VVSQDPTDFLHIEDYDENIDSSFINESLKPYLKDLFKDLLMRSNQPENIDKVTFIEYTKLPGIINDRLHFMFQHSNYKNNGPGGQKMGSPSRALSPVALKKKDTTSKTSKKEDFVTEESFLKNFIKIFIGDLDQKIKFTFDMYDCDQDGFITPEDIRIMMSYMPFKRNIQL